MQALKATIETLSAQLAAAEKRGAQVSAREQRLQQMRSDWQVLINRLNVFSPELTIDNLSLQKRLLANETEELEKIKNLLEQHAQLQRNVAKWLADIEGKNWLCKNWSCLSGSWKRPGIIDPPNLWRSNNVLPV